MVWQNPSLAATKFQFNWELIALLHGFGNTSMFGMKANASHEAATRQIYANIHWCVNWSCLCVLNVYSCACPGIRRQNMVALNHVISISNGFNLGYSQVKKTQPDGIPKYSPESDKARLPFLPNSGIPEISKRSGNLWHVLMFTHASPDLFVWSLTKNLTCFAIPSQWTVYNQTERFLAESHHFTPPKTPSPMLFWDHHQA